MKAIDIKLAVIKIMGVSAGEGVKKVAFVKCAGDCEKAKQDYEYTGVEDCAAMAFIPNGGANKPPHIFHMPYMHPCLPRQCH